MNDENVVEFFRDKLEKLQEEYDKLQSAYQQLIHDYECCVLDLKVTQQELEHANRTGYRNQHGAFSYPFGENN